MESIFDVNFVEDVVVYTIPLNITQKQLQKFFVIDVLIENLDEQLLKQSL